MKFSWFRVFNYRNIHDSNQIDVDKITAFVGQNESGKSNLFEALYRLNPYDTRAQYNLDEDWPADKWGEKKTIRSPKSVKPYLNLIQMRKLDQYINSLLINQKKILKDYRQNCQRSYKSKERVIITIKPSSKH